MAPPAQPPHRQPAPGPIPPREPGTHPTDSQGVRLYDAEDARAPRPTNGHSSSLRFASVNAHRSVSALLPLYPERYSSMNIFIPCFAMMYNILAAMNDKVCSLRPFSDNGAANDWIPQASVLVYSILAIIQTLRAQNLLRACDMEQGLFLQAFLDQFPLQNIEIPGPLVPFFRSLSVSQPGFGDYQAVGPALPNVSYDEEELYNMKYFSPRTGDSVECIDVLIPHIPLMLDQFRHLLSYLLTPNARGELPPYSSYVQLSNLFGVDALQEDNPQYANYQRLLRCLGFTHRPIASDRHMTRFAQYYNGAINSFPETWVYNDEHAPITADETADPPVEGRPSNWTLHDSFFATMGFSHNGAWFHTLLRGMTTFTQHFKGNVRMSDISPNASAAAMVRFIGVSLENIQPANLFIRNSNNRATLQLVFNSSAQSSCSTISDEDFEDSQMAQVNISCTHRFTDTSMIGLVGTTHFGDFWQVPPTLIRTNQGNLTSQFQSIVVSPAYFQE